MTYSEIYDYAHTYNQRRAKRGMAAKKAEMQRELKYKVSEVNHWIIMCRGISKNEPNLQKVRKELAEMVELAKEYA